MDTTTRHGAFLFSLFGALAQYERALTQERIMAGLAAAKRRGKHGGRPARAISAEQLAADPGCPAGRRQQSRDLPDLWRETERTLLDALARVDVPPVASVEGRVALS